MQVYLCPHIQPMKKTRDSTCLLCICFFPVQFTFLECPGVGLFGFLLFGILCASSPWIRFLLQVWEVYSHNCIKYTFNLLFSFFFFWDSYNLNVGTLHVILENFYTSLINCSDWMISITPSSRFLVPSSVSPSLLLIPSSVFHFRYCILGFPTRYSGKRICLPEQET